MKLPRLLGRTLFFALAACLISRACVLADEEENRTVTIGDWQLTAPEAWEVKPPQSRIITAEYAAPAAEGDERGARITVMPAGGSVEANIDRWKQQFSQLDDTTTEEIEVSGMKVHLVRLDGTYSEREGGGPFGGGKVIERPNYRMRGAIIVTSSGSIFVKMYGPQRTVDGEDANFKAFVESTKKP